MNNNPRFFVSVLSGPDSGKRFILADTCFLGSQDTCHIKLTDPAVLPLHARMTLRGDSFTVTDLSGGAAMKVNNRMVKSIKLFLGDTINVGNTVLKLEEYFEESERTQRHKDSGPMTEIVFVREKSGDDMLKGARAQPESAAGNGRGPVTAAASPAVEQRRDVGEMRANSGADREKPVVESPSMSGQAVVDRVLKDAEKAAVQRSRSRFVLLLVFIGISVVVAATYLFSRFSAMNAAEKSFNEAVQFAVANPGQQSQIIEKYKDIKRRHRQISARIRRYLDSEIDRLVAEAARQEAGLADLLQKLDKRAADLEARHAYDEAVAVYLKSDEMYRARVLSLRGNVIKDFERQSAEFAAKVKEQEKDQDLKCKAEQESQIKEKLERIRAQAVQALVDGDCDAAVKLLENIIADKDYLSFNSQVDEAIITARLLAAIDRSQNLKQPEKNLPDSPMAVSSNASLPESRQPVDPVIAAIIAIRKDDLHEARAQLDKVSGHLLYSSLMARAKISDEELKLEKDAIRGFAGLWSALTGLQVTTIPRSVDCVVQWKDIASKTAAENIAMMAGQVKVYQEKYGKTKFVRNYAELFEIASASTIAVVRASEPMVIESLGSGLGDAKVIQFEGNTVYVESEKEIPDVAGYRIGLFVEKAVFNIPGTNKAGAVRVDVRAVLPYRVLSKRQASFVLPEGYKAETVSQGSFVLIDKDLQVGPRIISILEKSVPQKVYSDGFDGKLEKIWSYSPGMVKIDKGKLLIDRGSGVHDPGKKDEPRSDLQLQVDLESDPVKIDFEMIRKTESGIVVGIGDVEFVIGSVDGRSSGIYLRGRLVKQALFGKPSSTVVPQKVSLIKGHAFAYVAVDRNIVACRISPSVGRSTVKKILFTADAKVSLDNLVVCKLPGSGEAQITAMSEDAREIIISRGYENEWANVARGQAVYVFGHKESEELRKAATARIDGFVSPDKLICTAVEGKFTGVAEFVLLSPDIFSALDEKPGQVQGDATTAERPVILYGLAEAKKDGTFVVYPDMAGAAMEGDGFFCVPTGFAVHPETGEKLAAWCGPQLRCEFSKIEDGGGVKCKPLAGYPALGIATNGVLISRQSLVVASRHDLSGKRIISSGSGLSSKLPVWEVVNGDWSESSNGVVSSWMPESHLPPMLVAGTEFMGNVQYDLVVRVDNGGKVHKDGWVKDLMIQLNFAGGEKSVTFGVGAGTAGGVSVYGSSPGEKRGKGKQKSGDIILGRPGDLGSNSVIKVDANMLAGAPALSPKKNYDIRVRRVDDAVTFYVNGKRLGYARCPDFRGSVSLIIAAPGSVVSIGKVSMSGISSSCRTPVNEPLLGEFGYVLGSDSSGIIIDSSMAGLVPAGLVSFVSVERVVEGEKSKTVFLKRAGLGTVRKIGPKTTLIRRNDAGEPIKAGMKILRGTQPMSFHFTDERISNIHEGL